MHKKIITIVSILLTVALCACELPIQIPMREVDVTPVSFEALSYSEAVPDYAAEPVKSFAVAPSTVDKSLIYDETNIALLNLYEEQTEIELQKQVEAKKKQQSSKKKGSSGGSSGGGSGSQGGSGGGSQGSSQGDYGYDDYSWGDNSTYEVPAYTPPSVAGYADQVVALVNTERANAGLGSVSTTSSLNQAAQKRAEEIVSSFAHTRPDGRSCFTVFDEYGVSYMAAGENIAAGQWSPDSVMSSWMNSPGHKANILGANFNHIGVGVVYVEGSSYGYYWVQLFTD